MYFTGCYNKFYEEGMYVCVVCKQDLFTSKTKYDSGCGWPAFNDVLAKEKVTLHQDTSAGMFPSADCNLMWICIQRHETGSYLHKKRQLNTMDTFVAETIKFLQCFWVLTILTIHLFNNIGN